MTIFPTSIRAKLTLTAVTVMGVLFILLGTIVEVAGRDQIMASVDSDLSRHAQQIIRAHQESEKSRPPLPPPPLVFIQPPFGGGDGPDRGPGGPQDEPAGRRPPQGDEPIRGRGPEARQGGPGGPNGGRGFGEFMHRLKDIGDQTLAVGPRFIVLGDAAPFAPPDMREAYDKAAVKTAEKVRVTYSTISLGVGTASQRMRVISKYAKDENGRQWVVQVPYPLGQVDKALETLNRTLLILLPVGLALTAFACLFLMTRIMRPIREVTVTADSIGAEDLSGRLKITGTDEFAQLGTTINGMLGRLEAAFKAQSETMARLEAVLKQQRRFTADASHELKTPLAVIKANTGLMLYSSDMSADERSSVEAIDAAATRMNRLVQGLMLLARAEAGGTVLGSSPFDLKLAVQNAVDQVHRAPSKNIIYSDEDFSALVTGSERDVERVFVNLIDNACRHTREDGQIDVHVEQEGNEAVVTVSDNGEGISAEHLPHLFERFYRADSARSSETGGTGLGLAICKGIVEAAGGTIAISSELGKGATVTVRLPIVTN